MVNVIDVCQNGKNKSLEELVFSVLILHCLWLFMVVVAARAASFSFSHSLPLGPNHNKLSFGFTGCNGSVEL